MFIYLNLIIFLSILFRPQKDMYYDFDLEKLDIDRENDKKKMQARQSM